MELCERHEITTSGVEWPTARAARWTHALTGNANVGAIIAIGSAARHRSRPTSDVDLIVVCNDARNKETAPPEIDARWVSVARLPAAVQIGDDVVAWGVAYGVPMYDPDGTWQALVAEWRHRLPLPSPGVCAQRAARARRYAIELTDSGDEDAASEQALTMLTHLAREALSARGVFPASRPELVQQLHQIGEVPLADALERAIAGTLEPREALAVSQRMVVP
jgi:predicted nucleotidyltransferase